MTPEVPRRTQLIAATRAGAPNLSKHDSSDPGPDGSSDSLAARGLMQGTSLHPEGMRHGLARAQTIGRSKKGGDALQLMPRLAAPFCGGFLAVIGPAGEGPAVETGER
jgi:hypothetical protein